MSHQRLEPVGALARTGAPMSAVGRRTRGHGRAAERAEADRGRGRVGRPVPAVADVPRPGRHARPHATLRRAGPGARRAARIAGTSRVSTRSVPVPTVIPSLVQSIRPGTPRASTACRPASHRPLVLPCPEPRTSAPNARPPVPRGAPRPASAVRRRPVRASPRGAARGRRPWRPGARGAWPRSVALGRPAMCPPRPPPDGSDAASPALRRAVQTAVACDASRSRHMGGGPAGRDPRWHARAGEARAWIRCAAFRTGRDGAAKFFRSPLSPPGPAG